MQQQYFEAPLVKKLGIRYNSLSDGIKNGELNVILTIAAGRFV